MRSQLTYSGGGGRSENEVRSYCRVVWGGGAEGGLLLPPVESGGQRSLGLEMTDSKKIYVVCTAEDGLT